MNVRKNIRRFWLWVGLILVVELAAITLWKRWQWFFPSHAVSELYGRYAGHDGMKAAFVRDFKLNDSVFVDVTFLEARTDSAWARLREVFNVPPPEPEDTLTAGKSVSGWLAPRGDYRAPMAEELTKNDYVVVSLGEQTVAVFQIQSDKQFEDIISYQLQLIKNAEEE